MGAMLFFSEESPFPSAFNAVPLYTASNDERFPDARQMHRPNFFKEKFYLGSWPAMSCTQLIRRHHMREESQFATLSHASCGGDFFRASRPSVPERPTEGQPLRFKRLWAPQALLRWAPSNDSLDADSTCPPRPPPSTRPAHSHLLK